MRIYWFFLTLLSVLIWALPANAAQLLFWRFEAAQNRLTFTTDSGVQPQAQLISDPTRIVIDLPGIQLNRPTVNQNFGGAIASLRIGQFDSQTTRLVIELAPGYTLDPQAIKFRGESPTQWSVELPTPQRLSNTTATTPINPPSRPDTTAQQPSTSNFIRVTALGFYLPFGLDIKEPENISVRRDRDRNQVNISLQGVTLPSDVRDREIPVNRYGVSTISFAQSNNSAELTLNVGEDSPDWWASVSRFGGLLIYPRGNTGNLADLDNNDNQDSDTAQNTTEPAVIEKIELGLGGSPLEITSDREIAVRPSRRGNTYQLLIPNARLERGVSDRSIPSGLSLEDFQIDQNNGNVVVTLVPRRGYTLGNIDRRSDRVTTVALQIGSASNPSPSDSNTIPVPPPENP
ncbi:MAG: AMIN domain-containing protein, partial [Jaaginema sp. PMC 1079.18]|nr:AMIN domain-containing protein [Jaaginema sp. PMC 1079.18]